MVFTYFDRGEVRKIHIENLLLQSKALRCLPLENKEDLARALRSGYWCRCEYEFEIKGLFEDKLYKMDVYQLSLEPNIDYIWEYYLANKEYLDGEAEEWWTERRKMFDEYYRNKESEGAEETEGTEFL